MPLDIGKAVLEEEVVRIDVRLEAYGETVWVDYIPSRYDWVIEKTLVVDSGKIPANAMHDFIVQFVDDWDITLNGVKVPITDEGLKQVDLFTIQVPIVHAILNDLTEGKALRTDSLPPSSTVKQPRSRSRAQVRLVETQ